MTKIIGQKRIVKELAGITTMLKKNNNEVATILLRGPAGYGKTEIVETFLFDIVGNAYSWQIPKANNSYNFVFPKNIQHYRAHFVDEVHKIKNPEALYPIIDSMEYIMAFASNEAGVLPDALTSRCFVFNLDEYTNDEIATIVVNKGKDINFPINKEVAILVASMSRLSPRVAIQYLKRIRFIISNGYYPKTLRGIKAAFKDIGIYAGGYTELDIRYLKYLSKVGRSSLINLTRALKIDKETIINEIEPFLILNNHVEVSARGRVFKDWSQNNG